MWLPGIQCDEDSALSVPKGIPRVSQSFQSKEHVPRGFSRLAYISYETSDEAVKLVNSLGKSQIFLLLLLFYLFVLYRLETTPNSAYFWHCSQKSFLMRFKGLTGVLGILSLSPKT